MQRLSLREAAILSGANKSTILRAIQSGRLAAERTPSNEWSIEEEELRRVYPPLTPLVASEIVSEARVIEEVRGIEDLPMIPLSAPVATPFAYVPVPDAVAEELKSLEERCATLEAELVVQTKTLGEMTAQRNHWKQRCEQLLSVVQGQPKPLERRHRSGFNGMVALVVGLVLIWLGFTATIVAIVDGNENHEAPVAITLLVIGVACCIFFIISKKRTAQDSMAAF
jgi:hypothetical protein